MDVRGQFHISAVLPWVKKPQLPNKQKDGRAPAPVWILQAREKFLVPSGIQALDYHACSLVTIHYNDYASPSPLTEAFNTTYMYIISLRVPIHERFFTFVA
jgi:hypothetical protein